jgi:leader peptidase (prepilin peptidase)/N-methyltransferase
MSSHLALLGGAAIGMAAGAALIPLTRRQLAGAIGRAQASGGAVEALPTVAAWQRLALVITSGVLPGLVLFRVGWSFNTIPPLLLLLGLIQLAYCDFTRRLLPKTLVYAMSLPVLVAGVVIAASNNEWVRLAHASIGGACFFVLLLAMNLMNPRWMAFGDVRLSPVVGFGLTWISPFALVEGFFVANVLAAVIGITLIALHQVDRKAAMPFGLYLALGAGITILAWS